MKKFFIIAMAVFALTIASCTNGQKANSDETEQTVLATATDAIAAAIEAGDASAIQTAVEAVKAKAAELLADNPEVAKEYLTKVQQFLKENAEKVTAIVGENEAVKAVVGAVTDAPVEQVIDGLAAFVGQAETAAQETADGVKAAGEQLTEDVKAAGQQLRDEAQAAAQKAVDDAQAAAAAKAEEEVQNAKDKTNDAIDKGVDAAKKKLGLK